ncbi:MAG TPA: class F sortase, partial [Glaciihabitans sp.]|nr:class F sortase [Glaciihabitans sp.]
MPHTMTPRRVPFRLWPVAVALLGVILATGAVVSTTTGQLPGTNSPESIVSPVPITSPVPSATADPAASEPSTEQPTITVPDIPRVTAALDAQTPETLAPARVIVDTLGLDLPVIPVGLDRNNNMELPADPAVAGWYRYGPGPDDPAGATVIAAHVDSLTYGLGPFAALANATAGTPITITLADGQQRQYAVTAVETTNKADVPWASVFDR